MSFWKGSGTPLISATTWARSWTIGSLQPSCGVTYRSGCALLWVPVTRSPAAAFSSLRAERGRAFLFTRGLRAQAAASLVDAARPPVPLRTADRWEGGGPRSAGGTDWRSSGPGQGARGAALRQTRLQ